MIAVGLPLSTVPPDWETFSKAFMSFVSKFSSDSENSDAIRGSVGGLDHLKKLFANPTILQRPRLLTHSSVAAATALLGSCPNAKTAPPMCPGMGTSIWNVHVSF